MGYRYQTGDRTFGGSIEERLSPKLAERQLNAKLGRWPSPLVHETSKRGCVEENGKQPRRDLIGLPGRFARE